MATHSSILARRIPWTEEFSGLLSMGSQSQTRLKRLSMHAHSVSVRTGTQRSLLVGWMDEWEEGRLEGGGEGWVMSGWVDGQRRMVDGWMSGWVDGWTRSVHLTTHTFLPLSVLVMTPSSVLSVSPQQDHVPFEGRTKPASHDLQL